VAGDAGSPVDRVLSGRYAISNADAGEDDRLALLEELNDPGTIWRLTALGVQQGWKCFEVGAGRGSIARWLSEAVGPDGHVVAADLDTRFLERIELPNLEVRRVDVLTDELPRDEFDLVHTRALLMHLDARDTVLEGLVGCLRPGGLIMVEEGDRFTADAIAHPVLRKVFKVFGGRWTWARTLPERLTALGLTDVGSEFRVNAYPGGSRHATFIAWSIANTRHLLLATGKVTDAEIDEALAILDDPKHWALPPAALVAAWGRRPL
jgi:SAM-dependent methyltransferase